MLHKCFSCRWPSVSKTFVQRFYFTCNHVINCSTFKSVKFYHAHTECWNYLQPRLKFFFFWYSAVLTAGQDSHHLAGGSRRRRTATTAARHLRSSHRWESCLGKIAEVVSRCLPRGFYFQVSFSWIVLSWTHPCRVPVRDSHAATELSWWSRNATVPSNYSF